MSYKPRLLANKLSSLAARFPIVIVCGARQVGKSTLIQNVLPGWPSITFDPALDVGNARQDPDLFLDNHPPPLVLDEIQYAPELVPAIKRRVDKQRRPGMYVLTGSQQWSVLRTASESLAGRPALMDLEGFCLAEIVTAVVEEHWLKRYLDDPDAFMSHPPVRLPTSRSLYEQLWRGFLPESDFLELDWIGDFYRSYLRTYVERDVRLLADVSDWQQFGRFTQLVGALTAQEVNNSKLGREIGITPQTAGRWLALLRATFQWFEIPAYHSNTIKKISGKAKGYVADTGLACSLQRVSTPQTLSGHPLLGALFESAVIGEIRKLASGLATQPIFYHWRSHAGGEVDLLLERDARLYPIEIRLTSNPSLNDTRGFEVLRSAYPKHRIAPGLVIAPISEFRRLGKIDHALPWDAQ